MAPTLSCRCTSAGPDRRVPRRAGRADIRAPMLRQGSGEPIVLFHGILGSERMWSGVVPLLPLHNDAIAPTALGHAGGPPPLRRPARIVDVIDDAERVLDSLGLST